MLSARKCQLPEDQAGNQAHPDPAEAANQDGSTDLGDGKPGQALRQAAQAEGGRGPAPHCSLADLRPLRGHQALLKEACRSLSRLLAEVLTAPRLTDGDVCQLDLLLLFDEHLLTWSSISLSSAGQLSVGGKRMDGEDEGWTASRRLARSRRKRKSFSVSASFFMAARALRNRSISAGRAC
jgi:hypothetical protein